MLLRVTVESLLCFRSGAYRAPLLTTASGACPHFTRFGSEDDQESPPRKRPENRAPQAASSQEGPPDKQPAQFRGASAGPQSSWGRKQGPEGTQDDPPGEGEVSRLPRQGKALRLALAAPRSSHPPVPSKVQRASQLPIHCGNIRGERPRGPSLPRT